MTISRDSLLSLEAYARHRRQHHDEDLEHRRLRRVQLGEVMSLQFEDEQTVRYQIQEMLRLQKVFEDEGIDSELAAFEPLLPDGRNWKVTLTLEFSSADRRERLAALRGVARHVYAEVEGLPRLYALADEDLPQAADAGSAVHLLRFELPDSMRLALRDGAALVLGCDHEALQLRAALEPQTRELLVADLED